MSKPTKNLAAVLNTIATSLVIEERPIPIPGPDQVVVQNRAIAVNPIDWKRQAWGFAISSYPTILGSDISGTVVAVGSKVTNFKTGDRVLSFANGFSSGKDEDSAFQTYTATPALSTTKLPDNLDFLQAVMLPMGVGTAGMALYNDLGLAYPDLKAPKKNLGSILIWGGASSVGTMAIQLARLSGYSVYAVASETHHAYLKSLGATAVFDYHSPTVIETVINAARSAGQPISLALDTISEAATLRSTAEILSGSGSKESILAHLLPWAEDVSRPDGVKLSNVSAENIWTSRTDVSAWLFQTFLPSALGQGLIVPSPKARIVGGGLYGLQAAMDTLKQGVSGEKLIVELE
ncbi:chaperonin 10-like protein [Boeremia exigua]|uniref:chaperonin 10-like protein n=1 Tax=Boeremia exigua TaxID=749465 RepID=UPI001E8CD212|nr:chaperonin 10-like protein [Boeremia exigua]KAH6622460.1 chaperonin 10-like protein [Boeremia exigua]